MDPATLRLLRDADDAESLECPPGFDRERELAEVRALVPIVEHCTRRAFEIDENVQDASFFTDLATYDDFRHSRGGTLRLAVLAIRFSSFGRLVTTWRVDAAEGQRASTLAPEVVREVTDAVTERGYHYVDAVDLREPYCGRHPHLQGATWWLRFFD